MSFHSCGWLPDGYAQVGRARSLSLTIVYLVEDDSACRAATVNGFVIL
jgi:hypothetical protein